jgi:hypothetical protein
MAPRDRDRTRERYPDPQWDENAAEGAYSEAYEDPAGFLEEDLPDWGAQNQPPNRRAKQSRASRQRPEVDLEPQPAPRRRSTSPLPELSRNLPTSEQRRPITRQFQPRQPAQYEAPVEEDWGYEETWEAQQVPYEEVFFDESDYAPAPRRRSGGGGRARGRPRPAPRPPSMPPALVAALAAQDRTVLFFIGAAGVSILFMSLLLMARVGDLPDMLPIHLDAAGSPDLWGTPSTLWRIVLAATMITLMNSIAAWFLSPRDPFVGRFLVGSSLLAHLLAWIALFLLLW